VRGNAENQTAYSAFPFCPSLALDLAQMGNVLFKKCCCSESEVSTSAYATYERFDPDEWRIFPSRASPRQASPEQRSAAVKIVIDLKRELEEERVYRSLSMSNHSELLTMEPNECLICLDEFTDAAPCVATVCGCGMNKNRFRTFWPAAKTDIVGALPGRLCVLAKIPARTRTFGALCHLRGTHSL